MNTTTPPANATTPPLLDPETQAFLDALAAKGGPQIQELPVTAAREVLSGAQAGEVTKLPVEIEDRLIPVGPKGQVAIRVLRPKGRTGLLPVLVYFHGGGWALGDTETHDRLIRELAHGAMCAVVFVSFSRAPEAHYPVAIEEAYAACQWVAANSRLIHVDATRLAVAGDSAGGNMAAVVTLLAKERGGPRIQFQLLFYPVTDAAFDTPSYHEFAQGYFLTREAMKWFWNLYAPDPATRALPTVSPLRATTEQLRGLPPALVINAECDVLRDEGEAYARQLREAGVPVTTLRCAGTIHDFVMLNALAATPAAREAINQASATLRENFHPGAGR